MTYSSHFQRIVNSTGAEEAPLYLLEINHPTFTVPARVVNDTQDLTSNGHLFVACGFAVKIPDQRANQLPQAQIAIDNVGKELVEPLENSNGGRGATVRILQVLRSAPDDIEFDVTLDLKNVEIPPGLMSIVGDLGYEDILNRAGIAMTYRPDNTPGIF